MAEFNNSKIRRILIEFSGKSKLLNFQPYHKLEYIKQKAQSIFFMTESNVLLKHNDIDLTPHEGKFVGDYFRNKFNLKLQLESSGYKNTEDLKHAKYNSNRFSINYNNHYSIFDIHECCTVSNKCRIHHKTRSSINKDNAMLNGLLNSSAKEETKRDLSCSHAYYDQKYQHLCANCNKRSLGMFCIQCCVFICGICFQIHHDEHRHVPIYRNDYKRCLSSYVNIVFGRVDRYLTMYKAMMECYDRIKKSNHNGNGSSIHSRGYLINMISNYLNSIQINISNKDSSTVNDQLFNLRTFLNTIESKKNSMLFDYSISFKDLRANEFKILDSDLKMIELENIYNSLEEEQIIRHPEKDDLIIKYSQVKELDYFANEGDAKISKSGIGKSPKDLKDILKSKSCILKDNMSFRDKMIKIRNNDLLTTTEPENRYRDQKVYKLRDIKNFILNGSKNFDSKTAIRRVNPHSIIQIEEDYNKNFSVDAKNKKKTKLVPIKSHHNYQNSLNDSLFRSIIKKVDKLYDFSTDAEGKSSPEEETKQIVSDNKLDNKIDSVPLNENNVTKIHKSLNPRSKKVDNINETIELTPLDLSNGKKELPKENVQEEKKNSNGNEIDSTIKKDYTKGDTSEMQYFDHQSNKSKVQYNYARSNESLIEIKNDISNVTCAKNENDALFTIEDTKENILQEFDNLDDNHNDTDIKNNEKEKYKSNRNNSNRFKSDPRKNDKSNVSPKEIQITAIDNTVDKGNPDQNAHIKSNDKVSSDKKIVNSNKILDNDVRNANNQENVSDNEAKNANHEDKNEAPHNKISSSIIKNKILKKNTPEEKKPKKSVQIEITPIIDQKRIIQFEEATSPNNLNNKELENVNEDNEKVNKNLVVDYDQQNKERKKLNFDSITNSVNKSAYVSIVELKIDTINNDKLKESVEDDNSSSKDNIFSSNNLGRQIIDDKKQDLEQKSKSKKLVIADHFDEGSNQNESNDDVRILNKINDNSKFQDIDNLTRKLIRKPSHELLDDENSLNHKPLFLVSETENEPNLNQINRRNPKTKESIKNQINTIITSSRNSRKYSHTKLNNTSDLQEGENPLEYHTKNIEENKQTDNIKTNDEPLGHQEEHEFKELKFPNNNITRDLEEINKNKKLKSEGLDFNPHPNLQDQKDNLTNTHKHNKFKTELIDFYNNQESFSADLSNINIDTKSQYGYSSLRTGKKRLILYKSDPSRFINTDKRKKKSPKDS